MLHLIFQSPIEVATLQRMQAGDVAIFFENSIFRLLKSGALSSVITSAMQQNRLCVLTDDMSVRGISADELIAGLNIIDYTEFVNLTVTHSVIQSWT